jgi:hypothetical protein
MNIDNVVIKFAARRAPREAEFDAVN